MKAASQRFSTGPGLVFLLWVLLVAYGVFRAIRGAINTYQSSLSADFWLLHVGSLITTLLIAVLWVVAGLATMRGRQWGWWLAGIVLGASLIGALLGFLQYSLMEINGEPLWRSQPDTIYSLIAQFLFSLGMILLLFTGQVRKYLDMAYAAKMKTLGSFLGLGFLLLVFQYLIIILFSWLNTMMWSN